MAPTSVHRYEPRSINSGMTFTIIFATLACVVIMGCFIWGFLVPYLREKYFPPKPVQTSERQRRARQTAISLPLTHYPYRQREASTRQLSGVTIYNPRLRTPFPTAVADRESIDLPRVTPPRIVSPAANTSQSLFTPIIERNPSCPEHGMPKSYTLPRVRSKSGLPVSTDHERDFGDAKEYILALPEPLRLRSQTHEGQLLISDSSEELVNSGQPSASAEKTLHPRKLFEQLKNSDPRNSACSSTSLKVKEPFDVDADDNLNGGQEQRTMSKMLRQLAGQESFPSYSTHVESTEDDTWLDSGDEDSKKSAHNASVAAMHRLRTYRSLVGAPPPVPLSRAGTLTRPKTPVAVMRNKYDRTAGEANTTDKTVSRNNTISTLFRALGDSSDVRSSQSSQTSPSKASPKEFAASAVSLLPTPLRIHQSKESRSASATSRHNSRFTEELNDEAETDVEAKNGAKEVGKDISCGTSKAVPTTSRPRPAPLALGTNVQALPQQKGQNHASPNVAGRSRFRRRLQISSIPASSIYSRDTQGMSIGGTPETTEFPSTLNYRPPFSPILPSTVGGTGDSDKGTEANLIKAKSSPPDTAKFKVENWRVDMENINFNTSPSPSLKRALSTLGPACNSIHEHEDTYRDSAISTELAPSEARLSSLVSPIRISDCTEVGPTNTQGDAPGGTYWV